MIQLKMIQSLTAFDTENNKLDLNKKLKLSVMI